MSKRAASLSPDKADLNPIEIASRDEISALQLRRMKWSLRHAYDNVAHYKKSFDAAGVHPDRVIAVMLDAGTDNQALVNDPAYVGNHHPRVRGERYDALIAAYLECAVGDRVLWGVGIDSSTVAASFRAIVSAVNRANR